MVPVVSTNFCSMAVGNSKVPTGDGNRDIEIDRSMMIYGHAVAAGSALWLSSPQGHIVHTPAGGSPTAGNRGTAARQGWNQSLWGDEQSN